MKFTSIITPAVLAACAMALPTSQKRDDSTGPFGVVALRSGSPIHLQSVNAAGQRFWIGVPTATFCPSEVNPCPPGTETVWANPNALVCYSYPKVSCCANVYKGRRSPRRPTSLRRPLRRPRLHPGSFRQYSRGLCVRTIHIHPGYTIRYLLNQRFRCYGVHGLSRRCCQSDQVADLCRVSDCDGAYG